MKNITTWSLLGLFALSGVAQADCNPNIPRTRPDSRYELVQGATPPGSEVRDKATGLVWQRCVVGMVWDYTQKTCTDSIPGARIDRGWTKALNAASIASKASAATAWRLPNQVELLSLVDRACSNPAINANMFPATPKYYLSWSSSPSLDASGNNKDAWIVDFTDGSSYPVPKLGSVNYLRLVRSDQ